MRASELSEGEREEVAILLGSHIQYTGTFPGLEREG